MEQRAQTTIVTMETDGRLSYPLEDFIVFAILLQSAKQQSSVADGHKRKNLWETDLCIKNNTGG